jgi:hypothetical protein
MQRASILGLMPSLIRLDPASPDVLPTAGKPWPELIANLPGIVPQGAVARADAAR